MKDSNKLEVDDIVRSVLDSLQQNGMDVEIPQPAKTLPESPKTIPTPSNSNTGRAAVLVEKEKLEIQQFPLRDITDDEILLKVEACGICGTDIHCYRNDPFDITPVVLGHEGTGEVIAIGKNVKKDSVGHEIRVGDRMVTSVMDVDDDCLIAKYNPTKANLSDSLQIYGLIQDTPEDHFNGYFGEYLIIRPGSSFFVVNSMTLEQRLLIEPAAVVAHALERAKKTGLLNFRSRVIVQGCGPIGLMMIAILRTYGTNNIIAIDGNEHRLTMAKKMGADYALNYKHFSSTDALVEAVRDITMGLGAHFAFQVTGVPHAAANLWKMIRRGGGICEVGFFVDNGTYAINPHWEICRKEISLVGSWAYTRWDYPNAYHFIQRACDIGIPLESLITHWFPLDKIDEAFQTNIREEGIKIAVTQS